MTLNPGDVVLYVDNYTFLGQTHQVFFKAEILSLDEKGDIALIHPVTERGKLWPEALRVPTQYLKPESMEIFLNPQLLKNPDSDVDPFIKAGEKSEARKTWEKTIAELGDELAREAALFKGPEL